MKSGYLITLMVALAMGGGMASDYGMSGTAAAATGIAIVLVFAFPFLVE